MAMLGRVGRLRGAKSQAARSFASKAQNYDVLIVGGGAAGLNVAAQLPKELKVGIVEPSPVHHSQERWAELGLGLSSELHQETPIPAPVIDAEASELFRAIPVDTLFEIHFSGQETLEDTPAIIAAKQKNFRELYERKIQEPRQPVEGFEMKDLVARTGADLIADKVTKFDPEKNMVVTKGGSQISYSQLVVTTGESFDFEAVPGLSKALENRNSGVMTTAHPSHCLSVAQNLWALDRGVLLLNQQPRPFQPTQILPSELESFYKHKPRFHPLEVQLRYYTNDKETGKFMNLLEVGDTELLEIRPDQKQAVFRVKSGHAENQELVQDFEMFLCTPPKVPSSEVAKSPLADATGYVDVDLETFQHTKYPNVFSFASTSNVPAPKDLGSIMAQSPTLLANLEAARKGEPLAAKFQGGGWLGLDKPFVDTFRDPSFVVAKGSAGERYPCTPEGLLELQRKSMYVVGEEDLKNFEEIFERGLKEDASEKSYSQIRSSWKAKRKEFRTLKTAEEKKEFMEKNFSPSVRGIGLPDLTGEQDMVPYALPDEVENPPSAYEQILSGLQVDLDQMSWPSQPALTLATKAMHAYEGLIRAVEAPFSKVKKEHGALRDIRH